MKLPFETDDLELSVENFDDEFEFFNRAMTYVAMECPALDSQVYWLFVTYLQQGEDTEEAMVNALVQAGALD